MTIKSPASKNTTRSPKKSVRPRAASRRLTQEVSPSPAQRIFLLSPANAAGPRATQIVSDAAHSPLAQRLRQTGATLGEVFSFISGLYFRGKLTYAQTFAAPPARVPGVFVITACGGLLPPETPVTIEQLRQISAASIDAAEPRYRLPLERDARLLLELIDSRCQIILLGSIATPKYVEPLLGVFAHRLLFPAEFVGRGDMSRGGLMLRCARAGSQLTYVPVATAVRHGAKPPKLPKLPRSAGIQMKTVPVKATAPTAT